VRQELFLLILAGNYDDAIAPAAVNENPHLQRSLLENSNLTRPHDPIKEGQSGSTHVTNYRASTDGSYATNSNDNLGSNGNGFYHHLQEQQH